MLSATIEENSSSKISSQRTRGYYVLLAVVVALLVFARAALTIATFISWIVSLAQTLFLIVSGAPISSSAAPA
jgi:membrane protein insertase Oxa1/YidC/SpoIIIJ